NHPELFENNYLANDILERLSYMQGVYFEYNEKVYIRYQLFMHEIGLDIHNIRLYNFNTLISEFIKNISISMDLNLVVNKQLFIKLQKCVMSMIHRIKSNITLIGPE